MYQPFYRTCKIDIHDLGESNSFKASVAVFVVKCTCEYGYIYINCLQTGKYICTYEDICRFVMQSPSIVIVYFCYWLVIIILYIVVIVVVQYVHVIVQLTVCMDVQIVYD